MKRRRSHVVRAVVIACAVASALCGTAAGGAAGTTAKASTAASEGLVVRAHSDAIFLDRMKRGDDPYTTAQCQLSLEVSCYVPSQIQQAYSLKGLYGKNITGKGTKIVIVDPYGSPTIGSDLAAFDAGTGLPGAWMKIIHLGKMPAYDSTNLDMVGWAGETTLDVEWAHAIAPGAGIVLVEAANDQNQTLISAVEYAVRHRLGDVVSESWGSVEPAIGSRDIKKLQGVYSAAIKERMTMVASAGDVGVTGVEPNGTSFYSYPVASWPATDPDVTAVGGTSLNLDANGNRLSADTSWNDTYNSAVNSLLYDSAPPAPTATGGGKSRIYLRPSFQERLSKVEGVHRGIPDISMSASCTGTIEIYQSFIGQPTGWNPVCGTSESAPIFAGIVALAAQVAGHPLGLINPAIYKLAAEHAKGIVLVTSGNNTVGFDSGTSTVTVHGYYAKHGYSLVAGVGTINAEYFVPELAHLR
jgi:subtilase family serine protease